MKKHNRCMRFFLFVFLIGVWGVSAMSCRKSRCERIAELKKKCGLQPERKKSLEKLEEECETAMRRRKKWYLRYFACLDKVDKSCKKLSICLARQKRKEKQGR